MAAEAEEQEVGERDDEQITRQQLEHEIRTLKEKLEAADETITLDKKQMEMQKIRTKQLIASWKLRLEEGEQKIAKQAQQMDNDMKEIVSNLMFLEGELRKEQRTIVKKLVEKDKVIARQEQKINALNSANLKLVEALNKLRRNHGEECRANGFNGPDIDHGGDSSVEVIRSPAVVEPKKRSSGSSPSPSPNRVRFKDDMVDVYEDKARNVVVKRTHITPAAFKHMRSNTISYF
ncbi:ras GTPase-activating protein nGAP-like [Ptychodera flava]|uniref:ras GTPase-activating protein nGAP-like n=1 Tax=Ptychodera flava TaxID=63121 RepID=UPI00396A074F